MPHPTHAVAVRNPVTGMFEHLDPARDYDPSDPLVKAFSWAFAPIPDAHSLVESVHIEKATAAPGEKRSRSRS